MIVLDSMGGKKTNAVKNIRNYQVEEWRAKISGENEHQFSSQEMKTVWPEIPLQENDTDCGIYLLHYIEKMFIK